ncbi:S8 family serine peptidase [Deinococcus aquiradiocola]|uniref:Serine protease n=1 Tax=Deinococcus aquiradiocola TaxID=393059 RepID=A0A917UKX1_9DEIO|nr:S8 family serine peptidase [Deinococcus aquiradiocola]GGJ64093.1 serine protease [Deinococcus aquiradiocola]
MIRASLLTLTLLASGGTDAIRVVVPALPPTTTPRPTLPATPTPATPLPTTGTPVRPLPAAPTPRPPGDPYYPQQWNLAQIHIEDAWAVTPGEPVTVAVLDTGYVRSDELGTREVNGYDFVSDPARSGDGDGRDADASGVGPFAFHAETVANLIGAARDGRGAVGVNPDARIVHVRVAGTDGTIAVQDLADAVRWAGGLNVPGTPVNRTPARVLNLSLFVDFIPLTGCDARVRAAIDAVTARGVLVVAGAANDGRDAAGYTPAACPNVLTVTAVDRAGQRPAYANWGARVALAAPGGSDTDPLPLWSAGAPLLRDGTSFAAPQVAGVASLMMGVNPALKPADVTRLLKASAAPFPAGRCEPASALHTCGSGIVNAGAALRLVANR